MSEREFTEKLLDFILMDHPLSSLAFMFLVIGTFIWWVTRDGGGPEVPLSKWKVTTKEHYTTTHTTHTKVGAVMVPMTSTRHHYRLHAWDGVAGVQVYVSEACFYLVEEGEPFIGRWE